MIGEIGAFYQKDGQVGGLFGWSISAVLSEGLMGRWKAPKTTKVVTANSYWLIKKPKGVIFQAEFYQKIRGQLVLIDAGTVELKLPDVDTINRTLQAPLRLIWIWDE